MPAQLIPSLNAGELSPRLESRPDLEKYGTGCRILENFLIMPYGGVNRRPGLQYMGTAKHDDKMTRLIAFNFSTTTNFILEFGDQYIRFWSNGVQVEKASATGWLTATPYVAGDYVTESATIYFCLVAHTSGTFATDLAAVKWVAQTILEVPSPYLETDVFELQYAQINDVMYIVHPDYPVRKLSRVADTNWTLAEVVWAFPPMRDENITSVTITPSGTTGSITLTASASTFTADNVGSFFEITHDRASSSVSLSLGSTANSASMRVVGGWELRTVASTLTGSVLLQRSKDDATWETIRSFSFANDRNISTTGTEEEEVYLRLRCVYSSGGGTAYLDATDGQVHGVAKITAYTSETVVTATVTKTLEATSATAFWSEGAWSPRRGYPRTVALHEQRLMFGGCKAQPQTIWGSAINDFEQFRKLTYDDSSIAFTIASPETNTINWMVSQQSLEVGTAGYEYIVSASSDGAALTPNNIQVKPQSHFGSKYQPAIVANEVTLFTQRQGRKIREFVYQFEKDGYVSADLTLLADHVTEGGVEQVAFQQQPDAILWVVTATGILAGMTYERGQNVVGWHRHTTDGTFESVASIYGDTGADEVWCVVNRTIDGNQKHYIERFDTDYRETLEDEDKDNWFYLDSAKRRTGSPTTTITGLTHLEGETVDILADGAAHASKVVASGQITLDLEASNVLVGLPYTSTVKPMPLDPGPLQDGTAQGRHFRINRLVARVYKSLGGEIEVEDGVWDAIYFRSTTDDMDDSPAVFTGDKERMIARGFESKATIHVRQTQPFPLTILGFIAKYEITGD